MTLDEKITKILRHQTLTELYVSKNYDEPVDKKAEAKRFFDGLKSNEIRIDAFHKAYDDDLGPQGLLDLFSKDGKLVGRWTYRAVANVPKPMPDELAALKKLWVAQFKDNGKFVYDDWTDDLPKTAAERQKRIDAQQKRIATALAEAEKFADPKLRDELDKKTPDPSYPTLGIVDQTDQVTILFRIFNDNDVVLTFKPSGWDERTSEWKKLNEPIKSIDVPPQELAKAIDKLRQKGLDQLAEWKKSVALKRPEFEDFRATAYYYKAAGKFYEVHADVHSYKVDLQTTDLATGKRIEGFPENAELIGVKVRDNYNSSTYSQETDYLSLVESVPTWVAEEMGLKDEGEDSHVGSWFSGSSVRFLDEDEAKRMPPHRFYFWPDAAIWAIAETHLDTSD